jgi:hypothetical protein
MNGQIERKDLYMEHLNQQNNLVYLRRRSILKSNPDNDNFFFNTKGSPRFVEIIISLSSE